MDEISTIRTTRFLSTLSLRRATRGEGVGLANIYISIHALLAESDARQGSWSAAKVISIHALLAESDAKELTLAAKNAVFLSTLSLRRATDGDDLYTLPLTHFYPRSPCGERLLDTMQIVIIVMISIHALLAESDRTGLTCGGGRIISIHALLAESDYLHCMLHARGLYFYPRSPCGERR